MSVVWRIAFRNIQEHRAKSLIVGIIILIGTFVLVVGNSFIDSASEGIRVSFINNFTGHVVVAGTTEGEVTLFGVQTTDFLNASMPRIDGFAQIHSFVSELDDVVVVNPQTQWAAGLNYSIGDTAGEVESEGSGGFTQLWGIEPASYRSIFPEALDILDGEFLPDDGSEAIMLSREVAEQLAEETDREVKIGDLVLLTATSATSGIKIREVRVVGIFQFRNALPQLDIVSLVDVSTARSLAGMVLISDAELILTDDEQALLGGVDEEALFAGDDGGLLSDASDEITLDTPVLPAVDLGPEPATTETDSGAWHFILIQLRGNDRTQPVMKQIDQFITENQFDAQVMDWTGAAGPLARLASGFRTVFNIVVIVISVVAVFIIMNTLVISITERIGEIGTMRAVGARRSFVRGMIWAETITLAAMFGTIGIALGLALLLILGATGLEAPNIFFQILFGGKVLHPEISLGSVVFSIVMVAGIALISSLYPLAVALRISPLRAMSTGE